MSARALLAVLLVATDVEAFGTKPSCIDASDARVQEMVAEAVGSDIGGYTVTDADRDLVKSCKDVIARDICGIAAQTDECCECATTRSSRGWHDSCHPAGSLLSLEDGTSIAIEEATVGTRIETPTGYEPILGLLHAEDTTEANYMRFATKTASMAISPLHHVFVNGIETDPSHVKLGDLLRTPHGLEPVTRIDSIEARGAYHVFVKGGSYYVDSILASDYFGLVPHMAWPLVRAYVEARYRIGVPVIPIGRGFFPSHIWAFDILSRLGAPLPVHHALSPVTIASSIATELANVAIEHCTALLGAAAMAAAVTKTARKLA